MVTTQAKQREQFGRFKLIERIGSGGMATVHRAIQQGEAGIERELVVKRILPQLANEAQFVRMFIEEAQIGAHLNHPNIVQIYDLGHADNSYFMAMEYVEGVSLLRALRCHDPDSPLSPAVAAYIVVQLLRGLHYAHELTLEDGRRLGLVHRDVSPANVMISSHGQVKLLDFGIAKAVGALEREATRTGTLKGKLAYMSPEQVEGEPLTARSDIFVSGTLLWEALTGRRLFKGTTDYQTLCNVVRAHVPQPSTLREGLSETLDEICLRALQAKPADRYESAEQMADELEGRVLCDDPVSRQDMVRLVERVKSAPLRPETLQAGACEQVEGPPLVAAAPGARDELDQDQTLPGVPELSANGGTDRDQRALWTLLAFAGGALLATGLMVAVLLLSGKLSLAALAGG